MSHTPQDKEGQDHPMYTQKNRITEPKNKVVIKNQMQALQPSSSANPNPPIHTPQQLINHRQPTPNHDSPPLVLQYEDAAT